MVERIWVEVNTRVNCPIKRILIVMEDSEEIDMDNPLHKVTPIIISDHAYNY